MVMASIVPRIEEERYLALLRAANAIANCSDCSAVSETLLKKLHDVTSFDSVRVVAFEKDTTQPCWYLLEVNGKMLDVPSGDLTFLEDSPIHHAHQSGQRLIIPDLNREPRFEKYRLFLTRLGVSSICTLPLTRGSRHMGVLSLGRSYPNAYDEDEISFLELVADHIGLAIDAAVNFYISQRVQEQLKLIQQPRRYSPRPEVD